VAPWKLHQNYALDVLALRYASVKDDVIQFERLTGSHARSPQKHHPMKRI